MKLNKTNRQAIIDRAIEATLKTRRERYKQASTVLADALYDAEHGDAEKIALQLPRGWLLKDGNVYIHVKGFSGYWGSCYPNGDQTHNGLKLSRERLRPGTCGITFNIDESHVFYKQVMALRTEGVAINKESRRLSESLTILLASVSNIKALEKVWPEGTAFFPEGAVTAANIVPHDLTKKINAMMGLPAWLPQ